MHFKVLTVGVRLCANLFFAIVLFLQLLADCITVCVAMKFGQSAFTPAVQEAWQKLLAVVASALGRQYH